MKESMRSVANVFVRNAAGCVASLLAVAVALLGRSDAMAMPAVLSDRETLGVGQSDTGTQISYLQVGMGNGENADWWPPRPE